HPARARPDPDLPAGPPQVDGVSAGDAGPVARPAGAPRPRRGSATPALLWRAREPPTPRSLPPTWGQCPARGAGGEFLCPPAARGVVAPLVNRWRSVQACPAGAAPPGQRGA